MTIDHGAPGKPHLYFADQADADFRDVDVKGVNAIGAKLKRANFAGVDLTGALLCHVDLRDADFAGADLTDANFHGSDVTGANFAGAKGLDSVDWDDCKGTTRKTKREVDHEL